MEKSAFGYALAANTDTAARSFKCGATRLATSNLRGMAADDQSGSEPVVAIFDVSRPAGGSARSFAPRVWAITLAIARLNCAI
jgi:hypothetical protein